MKLLFCKNCEDLYRLFPSEHFRFCKCGKTGGKYINDLDAVYFEKEEGIVVPLGLDNDKFHFAINHQRYEGQGNMFDAFVIPIKCRTFKKIDYPK
jgi:hypothetical protein